MMNTLISLLAAVIVVVNLGFVQGAATSSTSAQNRHRQPHKCPVCFYRNRITGDCDACDICPPNHVIRRPCTRHRNTVCGVFSEFHKSKFKVVPFYIKNVDTVAKRPAQAEDEHLAQDGVGHSVSVTRGGTSWKLLTLSLVGALVILSVFLFVFLFLACYLIKRKNRQDKQLRTHTDCDNHSFQPFMYMERGDGLKPNDYVVNTTTASSTCAQVEVDDEGVLRYREAEASEDLTELLDGEDNPEERFHQSRVQISTTSPDVTSPRSNPFTQIVREDSQPMTEVEPTSTSALASSLFRIIHNPLSLEHHPSLAEGASSSSQTNGQQDYVYFNPPINSYLLK